MRASDPDMTGQTCALPGCCKPRWPSVREGDAPPLACGNLHHQLLMAGRFHPHRPHPYQAILNRNADGLCALLCCGDPPFVGHSWCSRTHYLQWLADFTSSLHPDQTCMLPTCPRHVFVDETGPPTRFCGRRHEQKYVMLTALHHHEQKSLPSAEVQREQLYSPEPWDESVQSKCGRLPPLKSLMHSLQQYALSGFHPKNITVIEDFYEKHPWEVLTEGHACLLIARLKFTSKGRKLTTKGHYHWKQSGPRAKMSNYTGKYYTYMKRKGKEKEDDLQHTEGSYTMKEYTREDVKSYSLIQLVKEKPSSNRKVGKKQRGKQQIADVVDKASSQDTVASKSSVWNDDDYNFSDLLLLDDDRFSMV